MSRGFRVDFKVPEIQKALNQISAYDGKTAQKVEEAVQKSTQNIGKGAKRRVPVLSGSLKKSISTSFNKQTVTGTIAARKPHAHLVEFGASETVSTPETKKALAVDGGSYGPLQAGHKQFAAKAKIPKRREHPFMRPSYEDEKPNLIRNVTKAVQP